jgi:hypothetical protein
MPRPTIILTRTHDELRIKIVDAETHHTQSGLDIATKAVRKVLTFMPVNLVTTDQRNRHATATSLPQSDR